MGFQNKKQVGRPIGSKDSKPRKQKVQKEGPCLSLNSLGLAATRIPQNLGAQNIPIEALSQLYCLHHGLDPKLVDTSCLRPEIVAPERPPQESLADLPIEEGESLAPYAQNGSIDAELHSWTLQDLPWIEGAELLLQ